jgi:carbon monoxide dehydrogenase subunit G
MKIDNEFTVSVPIEQAWEVLTDLEGIAPCLPGAQLTGFDGGTVKGKVKIKVGPVTAEYAGSASFVEKDDASYRAVIDAKGKDPRGAGNASALITARLRAQGAHTVVKVDTDLKISGKLAQFGSGMIKEVSEKLLGQFVVNLEQRLAASEGGGSQPGHAAAEGKTSNSGSVPPHAVATRAPPEPEALDLMELAGGAIYKRLIPVAIGAAVVAAVIVYRRVR